MMIATDATGITLGRWPASTRPMGIGMMLSISERHAFGDPAPRFADILAMAITAEAVGMDAIWLPDHFIVETADDIRGVWEPWTLLGALAAATSRINLGVLVTCTAFRHPTIIVKMAEALDEISGGRFILGLGAGWNQPEFDRFGFPFDHRASRFEEAIAIIAPMLREGVSDFQGRFFETHGAPNLPRGPRGADGGPPILVGTGGDRMMRLVARYADAWNSDWQHDTSTLIPMLERLDAACREVGRDPATLVKTASSNIALTGVQGRRANPMTGTIEEIAAQIRPFRDLGLRHWVAGLDPTTPTSIEEFGRVMELV
jgi:alkanesulfonate monooxygenase SsuD/methylene tetrahydromethanopterin reductase-like flavin-dependent oxidoreductase (luciferase family)